MSVKCILLLSLVCAAIPCSAQVDRRSDVTDVTKASFFNPGISYEKAVGTSQSVYAQAFMNTSFGLGYSSSLGNTSYIYFDPAMMIQYRRYYNSRRRAEQGRRT